jgi:hypothetical protein
MTQECLPRDKQGENLLIQMVALQDCQREPSTERTSTRCAKSNGRLHRSGSGDAASTSVHNPSADTRDWQANVPEMHTPNYDGLSGGTGNAN